MLLFDLFDLFVAEAPEEIVVEVEPVRLAVVRAASSTLDAMQLPEWLKKRSSMMKSVPHCVQADDPEALVWWGAGETDLPPQDVVVLGTPVGDPAFVHAYLEKKVGGTAHVAGTDSSGGGFCSPLCIAQLQRRIVSCEWWSRSLLLRMYVLMTRASGRVCALSWTLARFSSSCL